MEEQKECANEISQVKQEAINKIARLTDAQCEYILKVIKSERRMFNEKKK